MGLKKKQFTPGLTREDTKHILVVDDEEYALLTMEFILEVANYRVSLAKDGYSALAKILNARRGNDPIDLIITDIQMPGLSGLDLIDKINELEIKIPVLVITSYGNSKLYRMLKQRGCLEYLSKPIEESDLIRRVDKLVGSEHGRV